MKGSSVGCGLEVVAGKETLEDPDKRYRRQFGDGCFDIALVEPTYRSITAKTMTAETTHKLYHAIDCRAPSSQSKASQHIGNPILVLYNKFIHRHCQSSPRTQHSSTRCNFASSGLRPVNQSFQRDFRIIETNHFLFPSTSLSPQALHVSTMYLCTKHCFGRNPTHRPLPRLRELMPAYQDLGLGIL